MRITKYVGASKQEVESKKFNIWIGISLGNKYFTKEHIKEYILWALEHTKEDVLVVIADQIHTINLEVTSRYSKLSAYKHAFKIGDEKEKEINELINSLPKEKQRLIRIVRWREVLNTKYHQYRLEVLFDEFKKKEKFYSKIMKMTTDHWKNSPHHFTIAELERLAEYFIYETPLYLNGAKYGGIPEQGGKTYLLQPYPGLGDFDEFLQDLEQGKSFPELTKKLKITDRIVTLEAYAE